MPAELHLRVDEAMAGTRIDRLLSVQFPTITRSRFQKLLRAGCITARGKKVRSAYRVLAGDDIQIRLPPPEPVDLEPEDIPLVVVHEDDDIVVVDKPAGMVVHPAAGNRRGTLVQALLHHFPALAGGGEPVRPGIVHRGEPLSTREAVACETPTVRATSASETGNSTSFQRTFSSALGGLLIGLPVRRTKETQNTVS